MGIIQRCFQCAVAWKLVPCFYHTHHRALILPANFIAGMPYNYEHMKDLSWVSSVASLASFGLMLVGLVTLAFWHRGNPKLSRMPDTLVNTWLLMCLSGFIEGCKGRSLTEMQDDIDHGTARY